MLASSHDQGSATGKYALSAFQYGKPGPQHWSLPEALIDSSDVSEASTPQSRSAEDIIRMRQELIQRRLQPTSQDNSRELTTNESDSHESGESELITLAQQASLPVETLEELQRDGILEKVPRNSNGELTSVGSLKHEDKTCQPCLFWLQLGCKKGVLCTYCHLEKHLDDKPKSIRASKRARDRLKKMRDQEAKHREMQSDQAVSSTSGSSVPPLPADAPTNVTRAEGRGRHPARRSGKLIQL